jgi:hypothetical protein
MERERREKKERKRRREGVGRERGEERRMAGRSARCGCSRV